MLSLLMLNSIAFPQDECGTTELSNSPVLVDYGGYLKPERTDLSNGVPSQSGATFKMVFVFVQFPNEDPNSQSSEWPIGQPPVYINQLFSENKIQTGNYWERYSDQTQFFSDYYMEVSRGKLDVTGITRNIILDRDAYYYKSFNTTQDPHAGYNIMLDEIYY